MEFVMFLSTLMFDCSFGFDDVLSMKSNGNDLWFVLSGGWVWNGVWIGNRDWWGYALRRESGEGLVRAKESDGHFVLHKIDMEWVGVNQLVSILVLAEENSCVFVQLYLGVWTIEHLHYNIVNWRNESDM